MIKAELVLDTATPALAALARRGENLQPLMERLGAAFVSEIKFSFLSSRSPYGVGWAALKLRQGQPLRDTGALMNSITYQADTKSVLVGPATGPSSKGAGTHQFGATINAKPGSLLIFKPRGSSLWIFAKRVVVPARPYLPTKAGGLPTAWRTSILQEVGRYLMEAA